MTIELEIEYKNMLTKKEYEELLGIFFKEDELFTQENYYFDTKDSSLKEKKMGLRLRKRTARNECTLKIPTENKHTYQEVTDHLTGSEMLQAIDSKTIPKNAHVAAALKKENIDTNGLIFIGQIKTTRAETRLKNGNLLVLDKSNFSGIIDYELEMEVSSLLDSEEYFHSFLKEQKIPIRPADKKIARMIRYSH